MLIVAQLIHNFYKLKNIYFFEKQILFFLVNNNTYQNTHENNNTNVLNRVYNEKLNNKLVLLNW